MAFDAVRRRYNKWGLVTRSSLFSVALLLCIQLVVQVFIRDRIEDSVQRNLKTELESSARVWGKLLDQNASKLTLGASVLASDFGFRTAVSSGDEETIRSALENSQDRIGATVGAILDTSFQVRTISGGAENPELVSNLPVFAKELTTSAMKSYCVVVNGRLHQFVVTPIKAPSVVGWIVMGFEVDRALASEMETLTSTKVLILEKRGAAQASEIFSSMALNGVAQSMPAGLDAGRVAMGGKDYAFKKITDRKDLDTVEVYLLSPMEQAREVFGYMKKMLVLIDAVGLLLFAIGSIELARRVSLPLKSLMKDAMRLANGDYSQKIADFGREDEVGNFARSFDSMRESIQASEAEVRRLAYWDRLTGLPNRAQFIEKLRALLQKAADGKGRLSVIVLDLDRFKHINDVLGYSFGDKVLCIIAERLQLLFSDSSHVIGRLGGGQFAIMLDGWDESRTLNVARDINHAMEDPVRMEGQAVDLRVGMGIYCCADGQLDPDVVVGRAEVAMYAAKRKSSGTQVYEPALDSGSALSLSMLGELRQAIAQNQLRLFLQPKIELQTNRVIASEALLRWQHPVRGMVSPMEFIPFAEQTGFIRHLTMWMIEEVARHWKALQLDGQTMRIAVNLSTRDLLDQEFPAKLEALLGKYAVERSGLCLEITESSIMDDPIRAEATLNELSQAGYKLSIDDFGTGYSSLAYLKKLPVNELKIDKSFVMGMENDHSDAQIVKSTIDLAHNLGLTVVAEGIENENVFQLLKDLSCDEGQGYSMSRPLPLADFAAWRDKWISQHPETASHERN